ncbi:Ran-specific GTPase-activating protein 2 [Nakaseomyces bracarensis]|uniref:Ran-specific GTPase-activating protein 2 n=1 Tax=Nakaseomyces bracarensis TaxID=273131 RepID=A0ABR4NRW7_9SACH
MVEELKREREESLEVSEGSAKDSKDVPETKKAKINETVNGEQEEKEDSKEEEKEEDKLEDKNEKPKFVFGATSAFKTGFGVAKSDTKDAKEEEDNGKEEESKSKPFTFGSGLSFGSGFNVLKTQEKEDESKKDEGDEKTSDSKLIPDSELSKEEDSKSTTQPPPQIKLQKQDVKSGEESEECLYQVNAKLFQLVDIKTGWKERGVGAVKINRDKESSKTRVVMRSRGILKVILNLPLVKGFSVKKGFPGSLQSEKYLRIVAVDENNEPTQYALRTGKEETSEELYQKIIDSIPK